LLNILIFFNLRTDEDLVKVETIVYVNNFENCNFM